MKDIKKGVSSFVRGRNFTSGVFVVLVICAVVLVNIICSTLTQALGIYYYPKTEADFSISETFSESFAEAEERGETVTVTFCMDESDVKLHSTGSYVYNTAQKFVEKYGSDSYITLLCHDGEILKGSNGVFEIADI